MMKTTLRLLLPLGLVAGWLATSGLRVHGQGLELTALTWEGKVAQLNAQLLAQAQFAHRELDEAMAGRFFEQFLDTLDGSHELFVQADLDEFRREVPELAEAILQSGDTRLAHLVYDRYLQRSGERAAFVAKALEEEQFEFSGTDQYVFDREDEPRPADVEAARGLWRQRLRADYLLEKLEGDEPAEIRKTLVRRYERQVETMKKLKGEPVLEMYLDALAHVYDPHSDYLGRQELEDFNISMSLSLAGVGARLEAKGDYCEIRDLVPGGPAARSGKLRAGDRIVAVAQGADGEPVDLFNFPLTETVKLIRGPKGSDVTLTVIPAGASDDVRETVTIQRDEIHLEDQEAKARIVDMPCQGGTMRIGVIDLPAFYASGGKRVQSATADVEKLIGKLQREGVRGLILDLRMNGGGSLQEAIDLTGLFIPSGAVVQTRDLSGRIELGVDDDGKALYEGPLVVMTSRFSASASEIVAGALQDYGRAVIVGDTSTFGKGTVQTILSLGEIMEGNGLKPDADPGALKVTISKFYRPGGASTQLRGVRPDLILPSFTDLPEIGESGLDDPMPWDEVKPAKYPRFKQVAPHLEALRTKSQERIAANPDFVMWREELAEMEKNREEKSISLNEAERRRERDEGKARVAAQAAQRRERVKAGPPAYEITLKNAAEEGLPEPMKPEVKEPVGDEDEIVEPVGDLLLEEGQAILCDYITLLKPAGGGK